MNGLKGLGRAVQLLAAALLFAWPLPVLAQNAAPTGAPVIIAGDEALAAGQSLSVDTSGIMDADGLMNPGFTYQWLADDAEITGATGSTYDLTAAVEGKVIKVRVSFTDDGSTQETLTGLLPPRLVVKAEQRWVYRGGSVEYDVVLPAVVTEALTVSVASSDADVTVSPSSLTFAAASWNTAQRVTVTAAAVTGEGSATLTHTAAGVEPVEVTLTVGERGEIRQVGSERRLEIWLEGRWGAFCNGFAFADGRVACRQLGYTAFEGWDSRGYGNNIGYDPGWREVEQVIGRPHCTGTEDRLVDCNFSTDTSWCITNIVIGGLRCYNPATGAPTISGTFEVSETLTADTSGIMDGDGLSNPDFTYQWLADGQEIPRARSSTYMLTEAEHGKRISVRVSFTDDIDNSTTLTSTAGRPVSFKHGILVEAATPLRVPPGNSVAYTVAPDEQPTGSVTVTVISSDTDVTVSPSSLTFTTESWSTAQTVTVSVGASAGEGIVTLTHTAAGVEPAELALAVGEHGKIRLVGSLESQGRLDIRLHGRWEAICGWSFTRRDGDVACRQLGYSAYERHDYVGSRFLSASRPTRVDRLDCTGTEDRLVECPYVVKNPACYRRQAVALTCHNPAAGAPTISGTFEVGETLTANTSGIMDGDGLSNPGFIYQWLADGQAISGATSSTYMVTKAVQGKQISVRVSFTDDIGNSTTFTSTAGGPVPFFLDINVEAAMPLPVPEGGSAAYTVALNTQPTGSVTVTVSLSDTDVTVSPLSLTFTTESWSTAQTVTVSAGQDADTDKETVTLTHAASGADYGSVTAVDLAVAVFDDDVRPGQPTELSASADGANEIDLTWTAPDTEDTAPASGYRIEVSEDAGVNWTDAEAHTGSADTTYAHTGLKPETTYRYRVTAISVGGSGVASAEASATTAEDLACGRSEKVRDLIVREAGVDSCGKVTAEHLANLQSLVLARAGTVSLTAGDFAGMSGLITLDLGRTNLGTLPAGVFQGLTNLTKLFLAGAHLGTLPAGVFQGLTNLATLDLRDNDLGSLPDGVFQGLANLTRLRLGGQGESRTNVSVPVALEKVGEDQFKAVSATGAPFSITVPITGALIENDGMSLTIPAGSVESTSVRIWSLTGATADVRVGSPLPDLPSGHEGYDLEGSGDAVEVSATGQWSVAISPAAIAEVDTGSATVTVDAGEYLASGSQTFTLEVGGTAVAGDDYTVTDRRGNVLSLPYTMTLPGGSRSVTTTVTAVDDTIEDSGETIEVTVRWLGSAVARQTITITDDDVGGPSQVTITAPDETLKEGSPRRCSR